MRIHANTLTPVDIYEAAGIAGAEVENLDDHGSRSRARAFNVTLSGAGPTGGRWGNSGKNGAADHRAASWDQWGIFLAELFRRDDSTTVPHVYATAADFAWLTGDRYDDLKLADAHHNHRWDWSAAGGECKCGAVRRRAL